MLGLFLLGSIAAAHAQLIGIPTVPFNASTSGQGFSVVHVSSIIVDTSYANTTDTNGSTLIPPTLYQFASTFADDLRSYTLESPEVSLGSAATAGSIFVTLGDSSDYLDAAGRVTSEGYSVFVTNASVTISGASPLGAWWGTRTILQQTVLGNGTISAGTGKDAPGWGTRGIMLDGGRHYYPPEFVVELCAYLSFFKQNTFHLHLSDNLYNNVDIYSLERQLSLYAAFRPWSDDPAVAGLNRRANESYTRSDFDSIQSQCAARGVTIIPEIESPGHALVISQWKPELGLNDSLDLLNVSYPDTIPTVETIWNTFMPWFHSKVVHIGADEYVDSSLTEDALVGAYTTFVNSMNAYISGLGKSMRIWATFPPSDNATNVDKNVSIQHWEFFEANPYLDFIENGYDVLNSDDAFYIVNKYSASYPQQLNITRIFHGAPGGGPYAPNIFDTSNSTNNPARDNPAVLGHIAAQWNDYGPNASTYSEAYYCWRNGLPALADKQWGGSLLEDDYSSIFETLHAAVPGQNLDRKVLSKGSTILEFGPKSAVSGSTITDLSGNSYDATTNCSISNSSLVVVDGCGATTALGSKGRNYTLSFSIYPTSATPGPIFSGPDSKLLAGNGTSDKVMLVAAGNAFALNYTLPVGQWTNASLIGRGNQTFLGVNGTEMEFLTIVGINGESFVWAPIAVEAPLSAVGGGSFEFLLSEVKLLDFA